MIYYEDNSIKIYNKDCRDMSELEDNSVQCVVTSPPYWGLRKYAGLGEKQFGLEPTPETYIEHTIEILREIRRVLRKDGVVFWNIGDSYAGSGKGIGSDHGKAVFTDDNITRTDWGNLKPKDLCLIPFRVAIAAQEDGWWVRSVIIWSKPNPMPESVTDRPTESHEYILMLTKSKTYYWDADAVRVPHTWIDRDNLSLIGKQCKTDGDPLADSINWIGRSRAERYHPAGRNIRSVWEFPTQPYPEAHFAVFPERLPELCIKAASKPDDLILDPFLGAGTTLWVAKKLGRKGVGYELSEEYCQLALERNRQQVLLGGE